MLRFVKFLIALPVTALVVVFAVSNRQTVDVSLWPLPYEISTPVFFLALAPLVLGILMGGVAAWFGGGKSRQLARERGRQLKAMEKSTTLPTVTNG